MAIDYSERISKLNWSTVLNFLLKKWYALLLAILVGGGVGYWIASVAKVKYSAVFTFVLSTDSRNNNLAGIASQLGFDAVTSGPDNIFSGDNIIELFKSKKLIAESLQSVIDSSTNQTLLEYVAEHQFGKAYQALGPFKGEPSKFPLKQKLLYRRIVAYASQSFTVFRKDKKLVIYTISSTNTDPNIAYYVSKFMLGETAQYFIETKTEIAAMSVKLLRHEADSIASILSNTFNATAANNDRTFNLNPSVTIQRSGSMFNQAKVMAYSAAYTEVMRNLEVAKINLQKESPLYRIIDEPELPLMPDPRSKTKFVVLVGGLSLILMILSLTVFFIFFRKDQL